MANDRDVMSSRELIRWRNDLIEVRYEIERLRGLLPSYGSADEATLRSQLTEALNALRVATETCSYQSLLGRAVLRERDEER